MHPLAKQIATDLQTTEAKLVRRVIGLKLGITCSRCLGSGRYSYCQMHGDRCFGCCGHGVVMPKTDSQWRELAAQAVEAKASGRVDSYLEMLRAKERCKNARDTIMAAWKDLDKLNAYGGNWAKNPSADSIRRNHVGLDAWNAVNLLASKRTPDWLALDKALADGLAAIAAAKAELTQDTQQNGVTS